MNAEDEWQIIRRMDASPDYYPDPMANSCQDWDEIDDCGYERKRMQWGMTTGKWEHEQNISYGMQPMRVMRRTMDMHARWEHRTFHALNGVRGPHQVVPRWSSTDPWNGRWRHHSRGLFGDHWRGESHPTTGVSF